MSADEFKPCASPACSSCQEVRRLRGVLSTVLATFTFKGHPGMPCLRTGWMPVGLVESWRAALTSPKDTP